MKPYTVRYGLRASFTADFDDFESALKFYASKRTDRHGAEITGKAVDYDHDPDTGRYTQCDDGLTDNERDRVAAVAETGDRWDST